MSQPLAVTSSPSRWLKVQIASVANLEQWRNDDVIRTYYNHQGFKNRLEIELDVSICKGFVSAKLSATSNQRTIYGDYFETEFSNVK